MAYTPLNPNVYIQAYANALSALCTSSGILQDANAADYAGYAQVADAVAQRIDTVWGTTPATIVELATIGAIVSQVMSQRTPSNPNATQLAAATYQTLSAAIQAVAIAGNNQINVEGITPPGALTPTPFTGNIFIDPANSTGNAKDTNAGTAGAPLLTWAGLVAKWGTTSPVINASTTVTFLSSQPNDSDPVVWKPIVIKSGINVALKGTIVAVTASVTLGGTVAKNRTAGANSLLQENLGATGAVTQLVINATHASRAWSYKSLGANAFSMSQPLVASTIGGTVVPAEVDTWTNGDTVSLNTLTNVYIADIEPTIAIAGGNQISILNITVPDFNAAGHLTSFNTTGGGIACYECSFATNLQILGGGQNGFTLTNCACTGNINALGDVIVAGGYSLGIFDFLNGGVITLDGDTIIGGTGTSFLLQGGPLVQWGFAFIDTNFTINNANMQHATTFYGGAVLYGTAAKAVSMQGTSRFSVTGATFTARWTAPTLVTGITMNGATNAISHSNANNPDVLNGNITTSVANLDAAQGIAGFGGKAWRFGGASVMNEN